MRKHPAEFNLQNKYDLDTSKLFNTEHEIYIILSSRTIATIKQEYYQNSKFN